MKFVPDKNRMYKLFSLTILIIIVTGIFACKSQKKLTKTSEADKSRTSLDWAGIYQGILPCADCPGIKTQLVLNKNMTYKIQTHYLERGAGVETEGKFSWNKDGNIITLDSNYNQKYMVGENRLFSLDGEGKRITGDLADRFILEKEKPELTGKNWKLIMLSGDSVKSEARQPFMILTSDENRFSGNTGCNNFFGTFELTGESGIIFSKIGVTKMACIGDNPEQEFMEVLEKTTSFDLALNKLILKDETGLNLAEFEEDYFLSLP